MRVALFGGLAARLGRALDVDLPGARTVAEVRLALARRHPEAAAELAASRARALVNDAVAGEDRVLGPADEIAFLPPLSGG